MQTELLCGCTRVVIANPATCFQSVTEQNNHEHSLFQFPKVTLRRGIKTHGVPEPEERHEPRAVLPELGSRARWGENRAKGHGMVDAWEMGILHLSQCRQLQK